MISNQLIQDGIKQHLEKFKKNKFNPYLLKNIIQVSDLFDEVGKVEVTRGNLQHETKKLLEIQEALQVNIKLY